MICCLALPHQLQNDFELKCYQHLAEPIDQSSFITKLYLQQIEARPENQNYHKWPQMAGKPICSFYEKTLKTNSKMDKKKVSP